MAFGGSDPGDPEGRRGDHFSSFGRPDPVDWKRWIKPVLWGLVALYTLVFVLKNTTDDIQVDFVFFGVTTKLLWALLLALALGVGLGLGGQWWLRVRRREREDRERRDGAAHDK